jgi:hypothetical protein
MAVVLAPVLAAVIWAMLIWRVRRRAEPATPDERAASAERLYYVALVAAVNGQHGIKRSLLKKARAEGFADEARLADPRLQG